MYGRYELKRNWIFIRKVPCISPIITRNEIASEMFAVLSSIKFNKSPSTGTEIAKLVKMGSSKAIAAIRKNNNKVFNKINI